MVVRMIQVGPLMVNCYIVGDEETKEAAVFDPGGHADKILTVLSDEGLKVKYIINTHGHFDHVGGNEDLQKATGAPILTHREEAPDLRNAGRQAARFGSASVASEASGFIEEGDTMELGSIRFKVIDLRGHSRGGLGFVFGGRLDLDGKIETVSMVICGDSLFAGGIGATDHPDGNQPLLLENIRGKVFILPDDTLVLPGHGPISTVGEEKHHNPFFRE
jgi:hydroxyacylglutathione hydrolase